MPLLPTLSDVVYTPPNPDGSRKLCNNCCLYVRPAFRCILHAKSQVVIPHAVCGYHVFGRVLEAQPAGFLALALTPQQSGLIPTTGTSCDRCVWYEPTRGKAGGVCHGAQEDGEPAPVEALGCCSRWAKG